MGNEDRDAGAAIRSEARGPHWVAWVADATVTRTLPPVNWRWLIAGGLLLVLLLLRGRFQQFHDMDFGQFREPAQGLVHENAAAVNRRASENSSDVSAPRGGDCTTTGPCIRRGAR